MLDRPPTERDYLQATVQQMRAEHWPSVERIYVEGIATGNATFETEPPASFERFQAGHLAQHMLVAEDVGVVVGWATLSPISDRCAYQGVAEDSVYVAAEARGRGIGRLLLSQLIWRAEETDIWTVQSGIFPENAASLALHHACGFRTVGTRERLGQRDGVWRDVLLVERRSGRIG